MRTFVTAALALALTAGSAIAGGFAPPVEEPPLVIPETVEERPGLGVLVPLLLVGALVAVAVHERNDDDDNKDRPSREPDPVEPEEPVVPCTISIC